jgi:hypothetical protein
MPLACRSGAQPAQVTSESWPELQDPASDALVGGLDAALGQELLDIAVAEREAQIEPDGVPDDLGRELVTCVGDGLHAYALPLYRPPRQPFP